MTSLITSNFVNSSKINNEYCFRAAIDGADHVSMKHLESARDKVLMGPERKSRIPDEEANLITAYHEGGHAVVAFYTKDSHPLHKVTIIPRGPSLGHTAYIPEKERYHVTKSQLLAMMDTMMGGRAAEELIFGPEKITSGEYSNFICYGSPFSIFILYKDMSSRFEMLVSTQDSLYRVETHRFRFRSSRVIWIEYSHHRLESTRFRSRRVETCHAGSSRM